MKTAASCHPATGRTSRQAFTLIELLVVISIIALLAGLIVSLIGPLRLRVKLADTQVKMNAVQQGMALVGQNEGSATYRLQQLTEHRPSSTPPDLEPGLGGIMTFGPPDTAFPGLPTIGKRPAPRSSENNGAWGRPGRAHLAYPWGKKFPAPVVTGVAKPPMMGPERFLLRHMSPFNTRKLLKIANILPTRKDTPDFADQEYMTNRKASESWNDAWGHPLVVAATLYQPTYLERTSPSIPGWKSGAWPTPTSDTVAVDSDTPPVPSSTYMPTEEPDSGTPPSSTPRVEPPRNARRALLDHLKLYQYNRSVYIAVAAVGPSARVSEQDLKSDTPTTWASSATVPANRQGNLEALWDQVNWVCQQAKDQPYDKDWSELSFDNPMWQGNKYDYLTPTKKAKDANRNESGYLKGAVEGFGYAGRDEHCLLSAPLEYR